MRFFRYTNSLATEVLIKMAAGAVLAVFLLTGIGYWYVYDRTEKETIDNLRNFVLNRTRQETQIFKLAEDNLQVFKEEYLAMYQRAPVITQEEFNLLFFRDERGATRIKRDYFDGRLLPNGVYRSGISGFIGNNVMTFDEDLMRRLVLGYRLIASMGPGYATRFANLHATFPDNAIILYYPTAPWGLNARADLIMTEGAVVKATLQQYNPERRAVWTGLYYDLTANEWTITHELPVDFAGKHLITPSHDVLLNSLMERLLSEHLEGSYNFIVSSDGELIAHPQKLEEIKQQMGVLHIDKIGDPVLVAMFEQIQRSGEVTSAVKVIDDTQNNAYLAVAKLDGPDWWYVTVYPKRLIRSQAHETASITILFGLAFLCSMMLIVFYVIQRNVASPVKSLKVAAEKISQGNFKYVIDGAWEVPGSANNEIGLLIRAFRHMAIQINDVNKTLAAKIEERTEELEAANKKLLALSYLDDLTKIPNRRSFDEAFQAAFNSAKQAGGSFALMICDIDYFKAYNDQYGHEAGDQTLRESAIALEKALEAEGHAYRYGGEEFAIIIRGSGDKNFLKKALEVLDAIRNLNLEHGMSPFGIVTVSAGLVVYSDEFRDSRAMFIAADRKLYAAKEAGRNRLQD